MNDMTIRTTAATGPFHLNLSTNQIFTGLKSVYITNVPKIAPIIPLTAYRIIAESISNKMSVMVLRSFRVKMEYGII